MIKTESQQTPAAERYTPKPVSFWLKFCDPLPDVPEHELKPREWMILESELKSEDNGNG